MVNLLKKRDFFLGSLKIGNTGNVILLEDVVESLGFPQGRLNKNDSSLLAGEFLNFFHDLSDIAAVFPDWTSLTAEAGVLLRVVGP